MSEFKFSHRILAYSIFQAILDKNIQLFDYEAITKDVEDPSTGKLSKKRLVAFGKFAGIAGMIDTFQCLGRRLLASGFSTPFLNCSPAYVYYDLDAAKRSIEEMGHRIQSDGLPASLEPLIFAFTGKGNVTKGANVCMASLLIRITLSRSLRVGMKHLMSSIIEPTHQSINPFLRKTSLLCVM